MSWFPLTNNLTFLPTVSVAPSAVYGSVPLLSSWVGNSLVDYSREGDNVTGTLTDMKTGTISALESGVNRLRISKNYDQSGNGNDLTQATTSSMPVAPSVNAKNGLVPITFQNDETNPAVQKWLNIPSTLSLARTGHSVFMVVSPRACDGTTEFMEFSSAGTAQMLFSNVGATNGLQTRGVAQKNSLLIPRTQLSVIGYTSGTSNITIYAKETSKVIATGETTLTMNAGGSEGKSLQSALLTSGYYSRHDRWAIVYYPAELSASDSNLVIAALQNIFTVPTVFTKRIIIIGDSIMVGFCTLSLYNLFQQASLPSTVEFFNSSQTGYKASQAAASMSRYTTLYSSQIPTRYFGELFSNDFAAGDSAATIYTNVTSIVNSLKAISGFAGKISWQTGLPRSNITDSVRITYNASVVGNAAAVDNVMDAGSDAIMGNSANVSNATYYKQPDQTHPTVAGDALILPYWSTPLAQ